MPSQRPRASARDPASHPRAPIARRRLRSRTAHSRPPHDDPGRLRSWDRTRTRPLLAARPAGWRPGHDVAGTVAAAAVEAPVRPDGPSASQCRRIASRRCPTGLVPRRRDATDRGRGGASYAAARWRLARPSSPDHRRQRRGRTLPGPAGGSARRASHSGRQPAPLAGSHRAGRRRGRSRPTADDGPFWLITDSVGGDSLAAAIAQIDREGTIVVFGPSGPQTTPLSFRHFVGHENARIQTFMSFASGPGFGADLALLAGLIDRGQLTAPSP